MQSHQCHFQSRTLPDPWRVDGMIKERMWRRHFVCPECGTERAQRRPKPPIKTEVASSKPSVAPLSDPIGRLVGAELVRRLSTNADAPVPARGLLGALARKRIPETTVER